MIIHSFFSALKVFPFLFLTYLLLEWLEKKSSEKSLNLIGKAGKLGTIAGAFAGLLPQCGFAAAASNFYAVKAISLGTLIAVFLTTSDEMLPILISNTVEPILIVKILAIKLFLGIFFGLLCDVAFRKSPLPVDVETLCEQEDCHCDGGGIIKPALIHSFKITIFVLLVTLALNGLLTILGESFLNDIVFNRPILGPITSAFVGLVPNCSASVAITQLYIDGAMSFGSMMAGTLSGAGVGLLVLFRINHNRNENLKIVAILYVSAVVSGILLDFFY